MVQTISVADLLHKLRVSEFFLNSGIPMGYTAGLPILSIQNNKLCLRIPYLKYKITGVEDKTFVYPIRYVIDLILPENQIVHFVDLKLHPSFKNVDFDRAVGLFRHDAIKHLDKKQYKEARTALLHEYDKVIDSYLNKKPYTKDDERRMVGLLRMLIEPSLLPIYNFLDKKFYSDYIIGSDK